MIDLKTIQTAVEREYDSRSLKCKARYTALNNVIKYIHDFHHDDTSCLELDKKKFKNSFVEQTGYKSQAAQSAINELYKQYNLLKNLHTELEDTPIPTNQTQEKKQETNLCGNLLESFPPVIYDDSEILILGTMPGPESLQTGQYYTSAHNSFWKIIATIYNNGIALSNYEEKLECLRKNHIALWDVYKSCSRIGAADKTITNKVSNDIEGLLKKHPSIKRIILNGSEAAKNFHASIPYIKVNSSASYVTLEQKVEEWSKCLTK